MPPLVSRLFQIYNHGPYSDISVLENIFYVVTGSVIYNPCAPWITRVIPQRFVTVIVKYYICKQTNFAFWAVLSYTHQNDR